MEKLIPVLYCIAVIIAVFGMITAYYYIAIKLTKFAPEDISIESMLTCDVPMKPELKPGDLVEFDYQTRHYDKPKYQILKGEVITLNHSKIKIEYEISGKKEVRIMDLKDVRKI